jgi:hypothetical protein
MSNEYCVEQFGLNKKEMITESYNGMPPYSNNRQIATQCKKKFGYKPSPAMIYATLGTQSSRKLKRYSGEQILELVSVCKKVFNDDYALFESAVHTMRVHVGDKDE